MNRTTLYILLGLQIATFAASIYSIDRLEQQTKESQHKQFKAEMQNIELKHKLQKLQMDQERKKPIYIF